MVFPSRSVCSAGTPPLGGRDRQRTGVPTRPLRVRSPGTQTVSRGGTCRPESTLLGHGVRVLSPVGESRCITEDLVPHLFFPDRRLEELPESTRSVHGLLRTPAAIGGSSSNPTGDVTVTPPPPEPFLTYHD